MANFASRLRLEPAHALALLALLTHVLFGVPSLPAALGDGGRLVTVTHGALCLTPAPRETQLAGETLPSPAEPPAGHHGACCMPGCTMSGGDARELLMAEAWIVPARQLSTRAPDRPRRDGRASGTRAHAAAGPRGPPRVVISL